MPVSHASIHHPAMHGNKHHGTPHIGEILDRGGIVVDHQTTSKKGVFLHLRDDLDFDAVDHLPVNLVFAILMPEDATEEHLNLLASLAGIFRDDEKRQILLDSTDPSLIRETFAPSADNEDHY